MTVQQHRTLYLAVRGALDYLGYSLGDTSLINDAATGRVILIFGPAPVIDGVPSIGEYWVSNDFGPLISHCSCLRNHTYSDRWVASIMLDSKAKRLVEGGQISLVDVTLHGKPE